MIYNILHRYDRISGILRCISTEMLALFARFVFSSTLLLFFWRSARTKFGEGFMGLFIPSEGAYYQILPRRYEAAGYEAAHLGIIDWLVVFAGMWGEILLPLMIVIGLWTRLAALGMVGFIFVMSFVDIVFHNVAPGVFFDGQPAGLIFDQRLYWLLSMFILLTLGGGSLSVDKFLLRFRPSKAQIVQKHQEN